MSHRVNLRVLVLKTSMSFARTYHPCNQWTELDSNPLRPREYYTPVVNETYLSRSHTRTGSDDRATGRNLDACTRWAWNECTANMV